MKAPCTLEGIRRYRNMKNAEKVSPVGSKEYQGTLVMTERNDMNESPSRHAERKQPEGNHVLHDAVAVESRQRRKQVRGRHQPAVACGGRGAGTEDGRLLQGICCRGRREAGAGRRHGIMSWAPYGRWFSG